MIECIIQPLMQVLNKMTFYILLAGYFLQIFVYLQLREQF